MKKQLIYLITSLFVIIIGVVFYMNMQKKKVETSILEQVPGSKSHKHITSDGEVVQHTHTPIQSPKRNQHKNQADPPQETVHPILRIWENMDFNEIRRKYQLYTLQEMIEKWDGEYIRRIRPHANSKSIAYNEKAEKLYPKEQWLQRLMDNGFPFPDVGYYTVAFSTRYSVIKAKEGFENPETKLSVLSDHGLPEDTTWEELEDFAIKFDIVSIHNEIRAEESDPSVFGGVTGIEGVFTPFTPNTVHVYISEDTGAATFTGRTLTQQQEDDLTMFGAAPEGITVVYTDKEGRPLPTDAKPRFYERHMAALEAIETYMQEMAAEHEKLFNTKLQQTRENTQVQQTPSVQQVPQNHDLPHLRDGTESSVTQRTPKTTIPMQNIPPEMLPKEPLSSKNMHNWLELLQELHGGELPRDLNSLKVALTELEAIRQAAQEKLAPRPTPPDRPKIPQRTPPNPNN